jgi:glycogen(starch) synthase
MVRAKGFDVALRALASLPDLHLTLAGDGVELPPLKQLAHELGIAHRVDFRGWVHPESVSALINEAGLVVVPSRWREPFGLVAVQAAQMGRPVVASNVGGLPEVVRHGVTGLLVAPDAPKELSDAIAWMSGHPEEAAALGAAAQKLAATHFSIDRCAGEYAALYAKVKTEVPP